MSEGHVSDPEIDALASELDAGELLAAASKLDEMAAQIRERACAVCGLCAGQICQCLSPPCPPWMN
jgi:hypothetical protein